MIEKIRSLNFKKVLKEIVIFAVLLFIATNVVSFFRAPKLDSSTLPNITVQTVNGSEFSSLHVNHNKPLLIHFWATWCPTCKMENSSIDALSKKFDVITIAVNSGNDEEIKTFMQQHNLKFQVINDANGTLSSALHVSGFPTSFIYNKEQKLEFSEMGYNSYITLYLKLLYAGR
jgi:thiol-disulfide isomerase/thioredoxin